ncbi:MAG: isochorismate synthase, partial [Myxococcota bacterium]
PYAGFLAPDGVTEGARTLAQQAISLAGELGEAVLIRAVAEVYIDDPVAWAAAEPGFGVVWRDGRTGMEMGAVGVRRRMQTDFDPQTELRAFLQQQRRALVQGWYGSGQPTLTELPLALGGFSFRDTPPTGNDPWAHWPLHEFVIPERMLIRWAGTPTMAVITAEATGDDDVETVARRLAEASASITGDPIRRNGYVNGIAPLLVPDRGESKERWCERIRSAREEFNQNELEKVVLARRAHFTTPPASVFDPAVTLERLRQSHPDSFVFGFRRDDGRWFLGATPELLARVSSGRFDGHALAGTIASSNDDNEASNLARELSDSVKNQHEHAIVIRDIESALDRHCDAVEIARRPTVRRLAELQHLETAVRGRVREEEALLDIVGDLHPTPAVGGHPRPAAARYLSDNESLHRGWYASPIGWVGARGEGAFAVALRCALITPEEAVAFVGAGIVADSEPEAEWEETELKLRTISSALAVRRLK